MSSLRWGILATGRICQDFVIAQKSNPNGCPPITAVGGRSLESAKAFAEKMGIEHAYGSYEELAASPHVDVVYVGTLHPHHHAAMLVCLRQGKHVLCEKPFCMNARETREVMDEAKKRNLFVMEAMWSRFFPASAKIRELIASGTLGKVTMVQADFGFFDETTPRLHDAKLGGGALLDIGIYPLALASMVYGGAMPEVSARGTLTSEGVDNHLGMVLDYGSGQLAMLTCSLTSDYFPCEARIVGTKGHIKISGNFWCPTDLVHVHGTDSERKEDHFDFPLPEPVMPLIFTNSQGFMFEAEHVTSMIDSGAIESPLMPLSETLNLARTMDCIRSQINVIYPADSL